MDAPFRVLVNGGRSKPPRGTMVAVGTRTSPRPPHRSRRALLTHRAPPSGQTSYDERCRSSSDAQPLFGSTRHFGSVSEPRPPNGCSPWVRPFAPRLPPGVASLVQSLRKYYGLIRLL